MIKRLLLFKFWCPMSGIIALILIGACGNTIAQTSQPPIFKNYNVGTPFTSITVDAERKIWAGTNKLGLFKLNDLSADNFSVYSHPTLGGYVIQSLTSDQSNVWVGHAGNGGSTASVGGLERIGTSTGQTEKYGNDRSQCDLDFMEREGLATRNIKSLAVDYNQTVWVAQRYHDMTITGGGPTIYSLTPGDLSYKKSGEAIFTSMSPYHNKASHGLIYPYTSCQPISGTPGSRTCNVVAVDSSSAWVSVYPYSTESGDYLPSRIIEYDLNGNFSTEYTFSMFGIPAGGVFWGICKNDSKGTWVTTSISGKGFAVIKDGTSYYIDASVFPNVIPANARFNENAIWKNAFGNIFMGTDKGLIVYNGRGPVNEESSYTLYTQEIHGLLSNNILAGASETELTIDGDDYYIYQWLATDQGIIRAKIGFIPTGDYDGVGNSTDVTYEICNSQDINYVEEQLRTRSHDMEVEPTFHEFLIETEICDIYKSYGIPCTQEHVYSMLRNNVRYQAPNPHVMNQDYIPHMFPWASITGELENITSIINSKTDSIQFIKPILIEAGIDIVYDSVFVASRNPEVKIDGVLHDVNELFELQMTEAGTEKCRQCATYKLFGSPAAISVKWMAKIALNSRCDGTVADKYYDPIQMFIDDNNYTITNYTITGHILHPGKAVRSVVQRDGKIYMRTVGIGYQFCSSGGIGHDHLGITTRNVNSTIGPMIFKNLDLGLRNAFFKD